MRSGRPLFFIALALGLLSAAMAGDPGPRRVLLSRSAPFAPIEPGESSDCYFQFMVCVDNGIEVPVTNDLAVIRASAETVQWQDGHLSYVAANALALSDKGLAVWESRTNLTTYSQDGTQWSSYGTNLTLTPNAIVSPDLSQTASQIVVTGLSGYLNMQGAMSTIAAGSTYTASGYYRPQQTGSFVRTLSLTNAGSTDGCVASFAVASGVVSFTSTAALAAGACFGGGVEQEGNGWWRLWVTGSTSSATSVTVCLCNYPGVPVTEAAWGGQIELGAWRSPYIPTTSTTATRASDNVFPVSGSVLATALRASVGGVFVQTNGILSTVGPPHLVSFASGAWFFDFGSVSTIKLYDGTTTLMATAPSGSYANRAKLSYAYNGSAGSLVWGSGTVVSGSNTRTNATGAIYLGQVNGGSNFIDGYIERLATAPYYSLFPTAP